MSSNPICRLTGIEKPVFQGGMAWISEANLAAAVSNAGGLGIISAGNAPESCVSQQIDLIRTLTDRPFGVNLMLQSPSAEAVAHLLAKKRVPVITTGAGSAGKFIPEWKEAGCVVIPVVASVAMAKMAVRSGADAVIAEGGESGGHVGDMTTMALIPQVVDVCEDVPVIAAGGIGDGRGVAAAFMLGAVGVQLGTRFLVAEECNVHENYKLKVLSASDISTIVTGKRLGHPVRSIKTPYSREYAKLEYTDIDDAKLEEFGTGALRLAAVEGDEKRGCFLAGQISGMINKKQTAKEIITEIFQETENILNGAKKWVK